MLIHKELKNLLLQAGLSEEESLIYLELLKNPAQNKWELVLRTGLNRNKVYRAFEVLEKLKMFEKTQHGLKALSPKCLVADLLTSDRKAKKLAYKIRRISPFLRIPNETVEEFSLCYNQEQILETYAQMSEVKYDTCLDFGDLEGYVKVLGGLDPVFKFRVKRFQQSAKNHAICTTLGSYTQCMSRKTDMQKFQSNINHLNIDFKNKWLIFSDTNDYVMFNDFTDQEFPSSVLLKSKVVADTQRLQFQQFYQNLEKF